MDPIYREYIYTQYIWDEDKRKLRRLFPDHSHSALAAIYLHPNPLVEWADQGVVGAAKLLIALWRWGWQRVQRTRWTLSPPSKA